MNPLDQLADRLRNATSVTVLTGAGVSAASGIPTFRGSGGLWRNFSATDLARPAAFARDPVAVWEWYAWRREQIAACSPNAAHQVLARWTQTHNHWRVVTQNVDDLHVRAGTLDLVKLHGSIFDLRCWSKCAASPQSWRDDRVPFPEMPPRCPECGGLARPGVVWFGESLDPVERRGGRRALQMRRVHCGGHVSAGVSRLRGSCMKQRRTAHSRSN